MSLQDDHLNPLLTTLTSREQSLIIVNFLSHLYSSGLRGNSIQRNLTGVKQSFLLRAQSVVAFESDIVRQASKSGRYTTEEIRLNVVNIREKHQLPYTIDMLDKLEDTHWNPKCWAVTSTDKKAIYLATAICFDTGRRISNVTHRDTKSHEDHCLRTKDVSFIMTPCMVNHVAGQAFRTYFHQHNYRKENVDTVHLRFVTQKQKSVMNLSVIQPIVINRTSERSTQLLNKIIQWAVVNVNPPDEEFLTRCVHGTHKLLLRSNVIGAMKESARIFGVNPDRISSRSLRKSYATTLVLNDSESTLAKARAGWAPGSEVHATHYSHAFSCKGGLSYERLLLSSDLPSDTINPKT